MRPGQQLDRVSQVAIPSDCTVVVTIEANNLGQHVSVTGVALCPRGGVPLPVTRCREWVDREHLIAGCAQRGDPRATVGLDTDDHLTGNLLRWQVGPHRRGVSGYQRVQPGDALQALRQLALSVWSGPQHHIVLHPPRPERVRWTRTLLLLP